MSMEILIASFGIAILSLVGVFVFGWSGKELKVYKFVVPFAIGTFLAIAFFELIPQTIQASEFYGPVAIVSGFLLFYLLSNILHTYHHHHDEHEQGDHCSESKISATLLLWGDAVHNFTDGIVIASAFFINPAVGIATVAGIALHEVPQEIAEYGVLLKAGYSPKKALTLNFVSALSVVLGALVSLLFIQYLESYLWVLTGVAAGNLLYIAMSDLLPGVHAESHKTGSFLPSFMATLLGVVVIVSLVEYTHTFFEDTHAYEHLHQHEVYQEEGLEGVYEGTMEERLKAFEADVTGLHRHGDGPYHRD